MTNGVRELAPEFELLTPDDRAELAYLLWLTIQDIRIELFEFNDQELFDEIEACVKEAHGKNKFGLSPHGKLVRDRVLKMELEDRAEITHMMWQWVPGIDDVMGLNDPAFIAEINRRIEDVQSGRDKGIPAEEFMKQLREKYG
jgi:putative addiction module component (TIGR02574 family)